MGRFLEIGPQVLPSPDYILGNDPNITDNTDEIRVPVPPGNHMDMEMIFNACPRRLSEVHPNIEAVGTDALIEGLDRQGYQVEDLRPLLRREFLKAADMAAGNDHEMAAGVRITVHHDKCALPLQEA